MPPRNQPSSEDLRVLIGGASGDHLPVASVGGHAARGRCVVPGAAWCQPGELERVLPAAHASPVAVLTVMAAMLRAERPHSVALGAVIPAPARITALVDKPPPAIRFGQPAEDLRHLLGSRPDMVRIGSGGPGPTRRRLVVMVRPPTEGVNNRPGRVVTLPALLLAPLLARSTGESFRRQDRL